MGDDPLHHIKPGDRVIETSMCAMWGEEGTVYRGEHEDRPSYGHLLVRWDDGMHTSLTGGSRRITDLDLDTLAELRERAKRRKSYG